jgi:hypothetical protein
VQDEEGCHTAKERPPGQTLVPERRALLKAKKDTAWVW